MNIIEALKISDKIRLKGWYENCWVVFNNCGIPYDENGEKFPITKRYIMSNDWEPVENWNKDKRFAAMGILVDYSLDTIYPYSVVVDRSGCGIDYLNIEPSTP